MAHTITSSVTHDHEIFYARGWQLWKRLGIPVIMRAHLSERSASPPSHLGNLLRVGGLDVEDRDALVRGGLVDHRGDDVRVAVGGRAAVLEVAAALGVRRARDADRAAAVGDA